MSGKLKNKYLLLLKRFARNACILVMAITLLGLTVLKPEDISYFQQRTISLKPHSTEELQIDMGDSIPENNSLFRVISIEQVPIYYYREIFSAVCFDNECRPLSINLYWNITGRYLGFELLDGEFLSKTDHEPFTAKEYEKLHQILNNESTPLAHLDYNQLIIDPNSHGLEDIDAISTATPENIAPYVVQGAAYTTYKLWHLIHGVTKNEVQNLTIKEISPELLIRVLKSPDQADKIWALEHIDGYVELIPDLKSKLFELMEGDDYIVAEKALKAINKSEIESYDIQKLLLKALIKGNYNIQILVITKMQDCKTLMDSVKMELVENIGVLNGQVLQKALQVLGKQKLTAEMYHKIAELLQSENRFISNSVKIFLRNENIKEPQILSLLEEN